MHTARFWMALAIPGGAPGYDDDKQFGNFITHMTARTSQRLREPYRPNLKSQGKATLGAILELIGVAGVRRVFFAVIPRRAIAHLRMRRSSRR